MGWNYLFVPKPQGPMTILTPRGKSEYTVWSPGDIYIFVADMDDFNYVVDLIEMTDDIRNISLHLHTRVFKGRVYLLSWVCGICALLLIV